MFALSAKARYAVAALLDLADAYQSGPLQTREISGRHRIPQHYLEQILAAVKRSALVKSYRGAQGGYELARHPDDVALVDVLEAIEGPLQLAEADWPHDPVLPAWDELSHQLRASLTISLGALARQRAGEAVDADFMI